MSLDLRIILRKLSPHKVRRRKNVIQPLKPIRHVRLVRNINSNILRWTQGDRGCFGMAMRYLSRRQMNRDYF